MTSQRQHHSQHQILQIPQHSSAKSPIESGERTQRLVGRAREVGQAREGEDEVNGEVVSEVKLDPSLDRSLKLGLKVDLEAWDRQCDRYRAHLCLCIR